MSDSVIEIDGSTLEGGGQILRIAVALSVLLEQPIHIVNVRAKRSIPGLKEQHLRGLELVTKMCNGKLKGGFVGSSEIEFWPEKVVGGSYNTCAKSAGSINAMLQVALPCALFANSDTTLTLEGGTNVENSPQIDYTNAVFRPMLQRFGATCDINILKRGYFPKGGGKVVVDIKPVQQLQAVHLVEVGNITKIYGWSYVAGALPFHLSHTMANAAIEKLSMVCKHIKIEEYKENLEVAPDTGSGIVLVAETSTGCILAGSALGKSKENPEQTGYKGAEELITAFAEGACLDEYNQDQVIILMVLAQGESQIRVGTLSLHTKTAIYVAEKIAKVHFDIIEEKESNIIKCNGLGLKINNYGYLDF